SRLLLLLQITATQFRNVRTSMNSLIFLIVRNNSYLAFHHLFFPSFHLFSSDPKSHYLPPRNALLYASCHCWFTFCKRNGRKLTASTRTCSDSPVTNISFLWFLIS